MMGCHSLWFWRNKEEHIEDFVRLFNPSLQISVWLEEYGEALKMNNRAIGTNKEIRFVKWDPPRSV